MALQDIKSTADEQTLFEGPINENRKTSSASIQDQVLLKALQDLIVREVGPMQTNNINEIQLEPEAERLIAALQEFISSVIRKSQSRAPGTIEVNLDKDKDELQSVDHVGDLVLDGGLSFKKDLSSKIGASESDEGIIGNSNSSDVDVLAESLPTFKEQMLRTALQEHVFNKMPIRLLCIQPHGSSFQITLLERGAIYEYLTGMLRGKMHEEESQDETPQELIKRLITKHAKYAILSHTWLRGYMELTHADWNEGPRIIYANDLVLSDANGRYRKLVDFCKATWEDYQLNFGWMDTVCIDKSSILELNESIRSMYNWYNLAAVCIVNLASTTDISEMCSDPWFTRGWTLQELLAPSTVKFYNSDWKPLVNHSDNDKDNTEIAQQIYRATTISESELFDIHSASISRRMQLAAHRQVTRAEDFAYSLMGIFNVSISPSYGEGGPHAFFRLLKEILVASENVLDILNWAGELPYAREHNSEILPCSPSNYTRSSHLSIQGRPVAPLILSHLGLRIPVILMPGMLSRDAASRPDPIGDYSATVNVQSPSEPFEFMRSRFVPVTPTPIVSYNLLDKMIFAANGPEEDTQPTFAVFNFTAAPHPNSIYLPKKCIALGIKSYEPVGKVSPTVGGRLPIRTNDPIVFDLSKRTTVDENSTATDEEFYWCIKKEELAMHGMQLLNIYL